MLDELLLKIVFDEYKRMAVLLRPYDLTVPEFEILMAIDGLESGTMGDLANKTSLLSGTLTGIVKRLEKRGFIVRHRPMNDNRKVIPSLTKQGLFILHEILVARKRGFNETLGQLNELERNRLLHSVELYLTFFVNT